MNDEREVTNWNLPNAITVVRIVLAPVVFAATLVATDPLSRWLAAILFVVVLASDAVDGYLARSRGLVTNLGALLDPIADKLVTNGTLICLSIIGELPLWVTIPIVIREVGITLWRLAEVRRGRVVPANAGGKLKTVLQSVAISLALAPLPALLGDWMNVVNSVVMSLAFALTLWSGVAYLVAAARLRGPRD
ncbi:MAG TPA: CDP-diacylglycerol--glycerol-3-phosphate 3-phosphatidyltransferase [Microbacteriaceae bacterium]|nr:CDP-diacylglycerol--glycerol-3-phosphate 3-phosphatidyltransferase [Microbacteriaceae bacterium]